MKRHKVLALTVIATLGAGALYAQEGPSNQFNNNQNRPPLNNLPPANLNKGNSANCENQGPSANHINNPACNKLNADNGQLNRNNLTKPNPNGSHTPLVLELDGSVRFTSFAVNFDLLGRKVLGFLPKTAWIEPNAGFLALDLDGSGAIENGSKLFGSGTRLPNGRLAVNGFEALAQYDANHDGRIDKHDPVFSRLLIWKNLGLNGRSTQGELKPLKDYGITSLSLAYQQIAAIPHGANAIVYEGSYAYVTQSGVENVKRLLDVYLRDMSQIVTALSFHAGQK